MSKARRSTSATLKSRRSLQDLRQQPSDLDALVLELGPDPVPHTNEFASLPAAGHHISHGLLAGSLAWRFVVRLDRPNHLDPGFDDYAIVHHPNLPQNRRREVPRAVVTNFVLDTGIPGGRSLVSIETMVALGYRGKVETGEVVHLYVQGLKAEFTIGAPGQAGRLGVDWLMKGSLATYFDWELYAPVMHPLDNLLNNRERQPVPRTVVWKRRFLDRVLTLFSPSHMPPSTSASADARPSHAMVNHTSPESSLAQSSFAPSLLNKRPSNDSLRKSSEDTMIGERSRKKGLELRGYACSLAPSYDDGDMELPIYTAHDRSHSLPSDLAEASMSATSAPLDTVQPLSFVPFSPEAGLVIRAAGSRASTSPPNASAAPKDPPTASALQGTTVPDQEQRSAPTQPAVPHEHVPLAVATRDDAPSPQDPVPGAARSGSRSSSLSLSASSSSLSSSSPIGDAAASMSLPAASPA